MARSGGTRKINGQVVETFGPDGPQNIVNVRGTGHTNDKIHYNRDTGMVTGKYGGTRKAGEKLQAFQANLEATRRSGDKEGAREMRDQKRARFQEARQKRYDRRNPQ